MAYAQEVPTTGRTKGMKLTAEDRRWREEDDVRTLAEAKIIEDDPKRLAAARKRAVAMAKEQEEKAEATREVANFRKPMDKKK